MKKFVLSIPFIFLGLAGFCPRAVAQDDYPGGQGSLTNRYERDKPLSGGQRDRTGQLKIDVDHLNHMFTHVEGEMRNYKAGPPIQAQFKRLIQDRARLNMELKSGSIDQYRVTDQVRHMHSGLHQLEEQMHARPADQYQWR